MAEKFEIRNGVRYWIQTDDRTGKEIEAIASDIAPAFPAAPEELRRVELLAVDSRTATSADIFDALKLILKVMRF